MTPDESKALRKLLARSANKFFGGVRRKDAAMKKLGKQKGPTNVRIETTER